MSDAVTTELKSLGLTLGARKRLELELKAHRSRNDLRAHLKTIGLGLGARMRLENCLVDLLPAEGTEAAASAIAAPPESDDEGFVRSLAKEPSLRLLCLHGYASNNFVTRCQLASLGLESKHGVACDLLQASHPCERLDTSVDAVLEPDAKVFSWFDMPSLPDATAQQRETMHACLSRVMRVIEAHGPYDGIFGFSQVPSPSPSHPRALALRPHVSHIPSSLRGPSSPPTSRALRCTPASSARRTARGASSSAPTRVEPRYSLLTASSAAPRRCRSLGAARARGG